MDEELQKEIRDFQAAQQQLQLMLSQKLQNDLLIKETDNAIEELRKAKAGTDAFKVVGRLLIKKDLNVLKKELDEERETLDIRIKSLEKQELKLRDKVMQMQKSLQEKLKKNN